uniref:YybH family protein n=1 Tax=Fulvivirga sp. TaxID=1931237 RepID=UPI004048FAF5
MNAQTKEFNNEEQKVLDTVLKMTKNFHNKDMDGVMNSYEGNAVIVFQPGMPVQEQRLKRQMFQGFFDVNPTFTYDGHEVFINGDIAIHLTPWVMNGTAPDGSVITQKGLSIAVLRKQEDGEWLMIFDDPYGSHLMEATKSN